MGNVQSINAKAIDGLGLEAPEEYNLPRPTQESATKLDQLIRANNTSHQVLFQDKKLHNHLVHGIVSAYYLGATPEQLTFLYEEASKQLDPWEEDSPQVVTDDDWKEFLGNRHYERGYFDWFSDKINYSKHGWQPVVREFLSGKDGIANGVYGGLTHAIIHLGYAVETDSPLVAAEALTIAASHYLSYDINCDKEVKKTSDIMEIIDEIQNDKELDGVYKKPSEDGPTSCLDRMPQKIAYYRDRLEIGNPKEKLKEIMHAGAMAFLATHNDNDPDYSFFLLHLLTCSQEVAEMMLNDKFTEAIPESIHSKLVQDLWMTTCLIYITQMRPLIKPERVTSVEIGSIPEAWSTSVNLVLHGPHKARADEHFIKAVRALLVCEQLLGPKDGIYAKGALQFARTWVKNPRYTGFEGTPPLDIKH